jgi:alkyl hydroperoxide reductase subunit AhpF
MALITDDVVAQLKEEFQSLAEPVTLGVAFQTLQDPESENVKRLVEEVAPSTRSSRSSRQLRPRQGASALGFSAPSIAVLGEQTDYGVRLYGLPTGYEFGSFVDSILDVSRGTSGLAEAARRALAQLERDVRVRVFSTPT